MNCIIYDAYNARLAPNGGWGGMSARSRKSSEILRFATGGRSLRSLNYATDNQRLRRRG